MADRPYAQALVPVRAEEPGRVGVETLRRNRTITELTARVAIRAFRIAYSLLRDRAEAEDAVQEALTKSCQQLDRLQDPAALDGWFFRVLTHGCMRTLRRRRLLRRLQLWWNPDP